MFNIDENNIKVIIKSLDLLLNEWAINQSDLHWKKYPEEKNIIEDAKIAYEQLKQRIKKGD